MLNTDDGPAGSDLTDSRKDPRRGPIRRSIHDRRLSVGLIGSAVVIGLGIVMAGFILGRATAPTDESNDPAASSATSVAPSEALEFPVGDVDRSGYWALAGITPVVADSFDRDDDPESLGENDTGAWDTESGSWAISDERATLVTAESGDSPNIAVIPGGNAPNRLTEVVMSSVEPGTGLAFAVQDVLNYWAYTADEGNASWSIVEVADGEATQMGTINVPAVDGTTISVSQRPDGLKFRIDGELIYEIEDVNIQGGGRSSGLVALGPTGVGAQWDRFFVGDLPR